MKIVCDENIPLARELLGRLGDVRLVPGRAMTSSMLAGVDLLFVRSVTRVDQRLLEGTPVRFVATATIGTDHVDTAYLAQRGIVFAHAPGSNAQSVAEYVTAALLWCSRRDGWAPERMCVGIVGVGNVGSRVAAQCRALGMRCLLNDPPRQRATRDPGFLPLETVLAESDIVTLHVPLTAEGPDRTQGMVDRTFLRRMRKGALLLNTSRGGVVREEDLLDHSLRFSALVLDVWQDEPHPDALLVERADIATPHIAGYSYDGKVEGARMVYEAACRFLGVPSAVEPLPEPPLTRIDLAASRMPVHDAVLGAYPIARDHERFREYLRVPVEQRAAFFDRYRREYPVRLEFRHYEPSGAAGIAGTLGALGFHCPRVMS